MRSPGRPPRADEQARVPGERPASRRWEIEEVMEVDGSVRRCGHGRNALGDQRAPGGGRAVAARHQDPMSERGDGEARHVVRHRVRPVVIAARAVRAQRATRRPASRRRVESAGVVGGFEQVDDVAAERIGDVDGGDGSRAARISAAGRPVRWPPASIGRDDPSARRPRVRGRPGPGSRRRRNGRAHPRRGHRYPPSRSGSASRRA